MVIGSISMHFHAGLCHKFTQLHTGLLPARNAVEEELDEVGVQVHPHSRLEHHETPQPFPPPQAGFSPSLTRCGWMAVPGTWGET